MQALFYAILHRTDFTPHRGGVPLGLRLTCPGPRHVDIIR